MVVSIKLIRLIIIKMPTIFGILMLISMIFMLSGVELEEKNYYNIGFWCPFRKYLPL